MQTTILIGLFICHFLADYTHLSTSWILNAKKLGKPLIPIFTHAMVHTLLMGIFLGCMGISNAILLMVFQLITHFLIDVWKGRINRWFPSLQSPANKWHWIVFGFDQLLHALVIIGMSWYAILPIENNNIKKYTELEKEYTEIYYKLDSLNYKTLIYKDFLNKLDSEILILEESNKKLILENKKLKKWINKI